MSQRLILLLLVATAQIQVQFEAKECMVSPSPFWTFQDQQHNHMPTWWSKGRQETTVNLCQLTFNDVGQSWCPLALGQNSIRHLGRSAWSDCRPHNSRLATILCIFSKVSNDSQGVADTQPPAKVQSCSSQLRAVFGRWSRIGLQLHRTRSWPQSVNAQVEHNRGHTRAHVSHTCMQSVTWTWIHSGWTLRV